MTAFDLIPVIQLLTSRPRKPTWLRLPCSAAEALEAALLDSTQTAIDRIIIVATCGEI